MRALIDAVTLLHYPALVCCLWSLTRNIDCINMQNMQNMQNMWHMEHRLKYVKYAQYAKYVHPICRLKSLQICQNMQTICRIWPPQKNNIENIENIENIFVSSKICNLKPGLTPTVRPGLGVYFSAIYIICKICWTCNSQPRLRWKVVSCSVAPDSRHVVAFHCIHIRPSFLR